MINADTIKNKALLTYKNQYGNNVQCTAVSTNGMTVMVILPDGSQCEIPCTAVVASTPQVQTKAAWPGNDETEND